MDSPTTEATAEENNDELKTLIIQEIRNCKDALKLTNLEWQKMKEQEASVVEAEKNALDEAHERIKQQECTYEETNKLFKTLPTKHKALLIEESFHAIKTAKAKLREENLCRAQASTAAYERETRILEGMIVKLQQVAEMAGILLDDAITVEQNTIGFTNSAENFQLSRPALLFPAAWLSRLDAVLAQATVPDRPAYVHAASDVQRRPLGSGMQQRVEKDLRDYINSRVHSKNERTLPDRTHKETPHEPSTPVRPNTPKPDPERETMGDRMVCFVKQGQDIICEVEKRYEHEIDVASRQYEKEDRATEIALRKVDEQYSRALRLKKIMELFWETEYTNEWNEGRKIIDEDLKFIRQERKELTNRQPRCEEHLLRRQNKAGALLEKQSRFYKALLCRVEMKLPVSTKTRANSTEAFAKPRPSIA
ncbi:hypothetical protein GGP41_010102 [Bipolaris sorokiniana]|uniref:Uncharacterized protein n=1 Tax=Cochliobolus sativus TaxID=45130 RepID=A0A8H6DV06_COCSA|nr:hypothetical protein GGP41_010102 [Bipolaris sorokiniana]